MTQSLERFQAQCVAHGDALAQLLCQVGRLDTMGLAAGVETCRRFIAKQIPTGLDGEVWSMFTANRWAGVPEIEDLFVAYARAGYLDDIRGIEGARLLEASVVIARPEILRCLLLAGADETLVPTPNNRKVRHCRTNEIVEVADLAELIDADCDDEDSTVTALMHAALRSHRMLKTLGSALVVTPSPTPDAREKSSPMRRARAV